MTTTPLEWLQRFRVNISDEDDVSTSFDDQSSSRIVQLDNGHILIVWQSSADTFVGAGSSGGTDIIGRIYDVLGNPITNEIQLNSASTSENEVLPDISALQGGGFIVVYREVDRSISNPVDGLHAEVYDNAAVHLRDIVIQAPVGSIAWRDPVVASIDDDNAMIVYSKDGEDVYGTIVNPLTGAIINDEFLIENHSPGSFGGADVAALATDLYVVVWADQDPVGNVDEVYYEIYNSGGGVIFNRTLISDATDFARDPSVTALPGGGFVVAWEVGPDTNTGIRVQSFDLAGNSTSPILTPHTTLAGNQLSPSVVALDTALPTQEFIVAWFDEDTHDLLGQRYTSSGAKIGVEFIVHNLTTSDISSIEMTALEDGRFAIAWTKTTMGNADVYSAIFDPRDEWNTNPEYPEDYVIGTPQNDSIVPIPAGAGIVAGGGGNDTFWVDPADIEGTDFDGGTGNDTIGLRNAGVYDFWNATGTTGPDTGINSVETLKFNAGGTSGLKTAYLTSGQMSNFSTVDFAQGGAGRADHLFISTFANVTVDYSGLSIVDFESQHDQITILGNSSGDETITGTTVNDIIRGRGGLDHLDGDAGFDTLDLRSSNYTGTFTVDIEAGTIDSSQGAETAVNFENVEGSAANETIIGTSAHSNILRGNGGDDTIIGGAFADSTYGGAGNDRFVITSSDINGGVEIIDGGADTDTIVVKGGFGSVTNNLRNESISSIEAIEFSAGDGLSINRTIQLSAKQFNDGDVSLNSLIDGMNLSVFSETLEVFMTSQTTLDLSGLTFQDWGGQGEKVHIVGDSSSETITGSVVDDIIDGGSGADILFGGELGNDILNGESGADTLMVTGNGDVANGGFGDDTVQVLGFTVGNAHELDGGGNRDTVDFTTLTDDFEVDLAVGSFVRTNVLATVTNTLDNFEDVMAGSGDDVLTGDAGDNLLSGGLGVDYVFGGAGDDTLLFTAGDIGIGTSETIDGGGDVDTILLRGGAGIDVEQNFVLSTLQSIEGVTFDAFDTAGTHTHTARFSNIDFGTGGLASDSLITGYDKADHSEVLKFSMSGIFGASSQIDLSNLVFADWGGQGELVKVIGTGAGDTIIGSSENDDISSAGGDDIITATGSSADTVHAGTGNDTITISSVGDTVFGDEDDDVIIVQNFNLSAAHNIDGGSGKDTVDFSFLTASYAIDLDAETWVRTSGSGGTVTDTLVSIEDVLAGNGDDTVTGSSSANYLSGGAGVDVISGLGGRDIIDGGEGVDTMIGGDENDIYYIDDAADSIVELAGEGYDVVYAEGVANYTLSDDVERLIFTDTIDHIGKGNAGDNRLNGNAGADKFLIDEGGADIFSGGSSRDVFDARASTTGIKVYLNNQDNNAGATAGDFFASIEVFSGSSTAGDTMRGGTGRSRFAGNGGDDVLIGNNNIDFLQGGADNDTIYGGSGRDTLQGGQGDDLLDGGNARDQFLYVKADFGHDTIVDFQDDLDYFKVWSGNNPGNGVAADVADFTITGNGTSTVTVTLSSDPTSIITVNSFDGNAMTIDAGDFQFY